MSVKKISKYDNPFQCARCGKIRGGGILIRVQAFYGSGFDTMDRGAVSHICDRCFTQLAPDKKSRQFLTSIAPICKKDKRLIDVRGSWLSSPSRLYYRQSKKYGGLWEFVDCKKDNRGYYVPAKKKEKK